MKARTRKTIVAATEKASTASKRTLRRAMQRKHKRLFSPAFFTPGTVFEVTLSHRRNEEPKIYTVKELHKNGPRSYVAETTTEHESEHMKGHNYSFNLAHVTRIIKQVPGPMVIERHRARELADRKKDQIRDNKAGYQPEYAKHPSQYCSYSIHEMLRRIINDIARDDQMVDLQKMCNKLRDMNIFHFTGREGYDDYGVYRVNKKKLRAAIKCVFNKCLVNHLEEQIEQNKRDFEQDLREMERDMKREMRYAADVKAQGSCYDPEEVRN